jgi:hypothetical protein
VQRAIRSIDVTPEWFVPRQDPLRQPSVGARIACGSGFAVISYQELTIDRNPLIPGSQSTGVKRARVVVIDDSGTVLFLQDYDSPAWPMVGAGILLAGGGGRRFVGVSWHHELVSAVAVYELHLDSQESAQTANRNRSGGQ